MAEPSDRPVSSPEASRDGRAALALVFRSTLAFFFFCALTFVASLLLFHGAEGLRSMAFLDSRPVRLWYMLVALQPTLWLAAILGVASDFKHGSSVWPATRAERMVVVFHAVFIVVMAALPALAQFISHQPLLPVDADAVTGIPQVHTKILVLNLSGSAVGVLLACGIVGVHVQLIGHLPRCQARAGETGAEGLDQDVQRFQRLRAQLKRFLGFAAVIISSSLLCIGAFRNVFNAIRPQPTEVIPVTMGMGTGVYFTGLLASLYLPASKTLAEAGQALADRLVRQSVGTQITWKQWSDEQQAVRTYLGLQASPVQELQQAITLLAPLIASISTLILGTAR